MGYISDTGDGAPPGRKVNRLSKANGSYANA
jgi:hypothetical protein